MRCNWNKYNVGCEYSDLGCKREMERYDKQSDKQNQREQANK